MRLAFLAFLVAVLGIVPVRAADANRLTYLDESDPYYVSGTFPRLTTPQWVGEPGVDAVVILAIDDMRGHERWEAYLRPILKRLQQIDGRAPVSIMTCQIDPQQPHLQTWLKEGLSLEIHTVDHPCPLLRGGDFAKAKSTYDRCIDMLGEVPGNRPVAFRTPCCDSLNTPSPRFYAEIFNQTTPKGKFLTIDSSVFNLLTSKDRDLPRELVLDEDGRERFRKYLPADRTFVNTIENYPYPYVIGRLCWQFPCAAPSDWSAQHYHKPNNPVTVRDWKAIIDATVIKQGVFCLVFHPHGWIKNEQVIDLIDHAVARHGKKVKFLTFREAQERLDRHLLGSQPIRAANGQDNGVRLLDLDGDGYLDVIVGNEKARQTRLWSARDRKWTTGDFPVSLVSVDEKGRRQDAGVRFGTLRPAGRPSLLVRTDKTTGSWHFDGSQWVEERAALAGLALDGQAIFTAQEGRDTGVRLRDLNGDGVCELIVSNERQQAVFSWSPDRMTWRRLPFALPGEARIVDAAGKDDGLRFADLNEDGRDDVIFANERGYGLYLFGSIEKGWDRCVKSSQRSETVTIPMITRNGTNNGAWFHSRHMWVQNENTNLLKDLVERRSFADLLKVTKPQP